LPTQVAVTSRYWPIRDRLGPRQCEATVRLWQFRIFHVTRTIEASRNKTVPEWIRRDPVHARYGNICWVHTSTFDAISVIKARLKKILKVLYRNYLYGQNRLSVQPLNLDPFDFELILN